MLRSLFSMKTTILMLLLLFKERQLAWFYVVVVRVKGDCEKRDFVSRKSVE